MKRFSSGRLMRWVILSAVLGGNLGLGARLYRIEAATPVSDAPYESMALFTRALEQVRTFYADADRVAYTNLIQSALRGMLASLDPHSQYLDAELFQGVQDDASGQFGGVGIVISARDGLLTVVAPMEDTPGFRAGLMAGDQIIEIDGEPTQDINMEQAIKRLRGAPGTRLSLRIMRPETRDVLTVELERAVIVVASVKDARVLTDGIGYVRLIQFNEPTAARLREAVEELREQGIRGLIVDVRNNPGGLLTTAVEVTQLFLPRGEVVVSTRPRAPEQAQVYRSRGAQRFLDLHLVVLVNGGSASAAEIFAGALQDHRRAVLVGEQTFGKGSVQSILPLGDGSALRLTTARYYTPKDRLIHERGLEPDIVIPMRPEDWRQLMRQRAEAEGTLEGAPGRPGAPLVQDVQLQRAVDVLKGILLFRAAHPPGWPAAGIEQHGITAGRPGVG